MSRSSAKPEFRILVTILMLVFSIALVAAGIALIANRPPSTSALAATMTALPSPTAIPTSTPTPAPTIPGVSEELLVCQREAGFALNKRNLVGAANISDDHLLSLSWVSHDWAIEDLDDALPGIVSGFDAALDVWQNGCAVYDRVQVNVWDRQQDKQVHRLSAEARIDDLLKWRAGELSDKELILRLQVIQNQ